MALSGFIGAGKSSVGRLLASALERPFVDTDEPAERAVGRSIVEAFRDGDEATFRKTRWRPFARRCRDRRR